MAIDVKDGFGSELRDLDEGEEPRMDAAMEAAHRALGQDMVAVAIVVLRQAPDGGFYSCVGMRAAVSGIDAHLLEMVADSVATWRREKAKGMT